MGWADKDISELLHAISDLVHQNTRIVAVLNCFRKSSTMKRPNIRFGSVRFGGSVFFRRFGSVRFGGKF